MLPIVSVYDVSAVLLVAVVVGAALLVAFTQSMTVSTDATPRILSLRGTDPPIDANSSTTKQHWPAILLIDRLLDVRIGVLKDSESKSMVAGSPGCSVLAVLQLAT